MRIGRHRIGPDALPYLIAEVGVNHENDLELAERMIGEVARAGGQAVKFQTYKAAKLASRESAAYWDRSKEPAASQFELFQRYDRFGRREYEALARCCDKAGVDFLSTPFDTECVGWLAELVPAFKIASADLTHLPLLEAVAATGKPVVLSTGASTLEETRAAVRFLERAGSGEVAILHCVLSYPTAPADANLAVISALRAAFPDHVVGYSDHVPPDPRMRVLAAAYVLGARVIEKHYTFDKRRPGNDHYHAMDEADLRAAVNEFAALRELLGRGEKRVLEAEQAARLHARRSLVAARDLPAGHVLAAGDLEIKRPGTGIPPQELPGVIGRALARAVRADQVLFASDLAGEGDPR
jgi:N-acetylneuraminate synthase